jgi:hypothetical protein
VVRIVFENTDCGTTGASEDEGTTSIETVTDVAAAGGGIANVDSSAEVTAAEEDG